MKLCDPSLQVYKKNLFVHVFWLQLLLPKRLWKCTSTIFFWKYMRKVVLLKIYHFIHLSQLFLCWIETELSFFFSFFFFDVVLNMILSNKLKFFAFLQYKDYKSILLFAQPVYFDIYFFIKSLIVLYHGDNSVPFCFDDSIKFTLSTIFSTMKKL